MQLTTTKMEIAVVFSPCYETVPKSHLSGFPSHIQFHGVNVTNDSHNNWRQSHGIYQFRTPPLLYYIIRTISFAVAPQSYRLRGGFTAIAPHLLSLNSCTTTKEMCIHLFFQRENSLLFSNVFRLHFFHDFSCILKNM